MKLLSTFLLSIFISIGLYGQIDRSEPPIASGSPDINFGEYNIFTLKNGLTIIVVEDHKLPRIAIDLFIDRDPLVEGEKAGYVSLAGEMMRQGTESMPKEKLDETIDFIGASLSTSSQGAFARGLSKYNERLVKILADVTMNPAFPQEEFDKLKKQQVSGLETQKDDPDALSSRLFNAMLYGKDHPYGEFATIESTEKISLEDCKKYYGDYWLPNEAYLTFVGDIKAKDAKKLAKKFFKNWEAGAVKSHDYAKPPKPGKTQVSIIDRSSSVQTVLSLGNTIELNPGDADIVKLALTNQILGGGSIGRLFQNIREDKGYTYGAYSNYDDDPLIGEFTAGASVRTEVTDSSVTEFLYEFDRLHNEAVPQEDIQAAKNFIIGSFGRALERPQTMARLALNVQRYNLPEDYYEQYLKRLSALTANDIKEAANKYIQADALRITAVGKGTAIAPKLEKFGEIQFYDYQVNPVEAPAMDLPEGLTAAQVIEDYIKAIGGKETIAQIQDLEINMSVNIPGMPAPASGTAKYLNDEMYLMEMKMQGMGTLQKQVYNGEVATESGMQGSKEITGDELKDFKLETYMVPELHYDDLGVTTELKEMATIDGEKAYGVAITLPSGKKSMHYFSAESGLKLKTSTREETPNGTVTQDVMMSDYQNYDGLMQPKVQKIKVGGQLITLTIEQVKVNSGDVTEADFQ